MTRLFDHFVLTRFNVALADRTAPSEAWLRSRLDLFSRTMLPAMAAQTEKGFVWLVLCDARSPAWFVQEITDRLGSTGTPVWLKEQFSPELMSSEVSLRAARPYLITTRVDNDDSVARDFIEQIQNHFVSQNMEFLNFTHGAQYQDGWVYYRSDPANAFCSLIERNSGQAVKTVFVDWHNRIGQHGPIRQINTVPMWLQVVHGENLQNSVHGVRARPSILQNFAHELPVKTVGRLLLLTLAAIDTAKLAWRVVQQPHRIIWIWQTLSAR